jgi:hypothetical protein
MGHRINGFIFRAGLMAPALQRHGLEHEPAAPLPQGFAFLPLTDELYDKISRLSTEPTPFTNFTYLSLPIARLAEEISKTAALAYIETDYHGGVGTQAAVLWRAGRLAAGPYFRWGRGPINKALRALGVKRRGWMQDRFDALALGRHRSNEKWMGQRESE